MPKYPTVNKTKPRTIITEKHLQVLKSHFDSDPKPSKEVRAQLSKELELSEESIRIWFQNQRTKARSTGELPAICRDRGNRFITSNELRPPYTPEYSLYSNYPILSDSPASISPSYIPVDYNCFPLNDSIDPQFDFLQNYSQLPIDNYDLMPLPTDEMISNELIIQDFLASLQNFPSFKL